MHFGVLRMKRSTVNAAATWSADHDGHSSAPAIAALGSEVRDLIERAGDEVCKLHFRNRTHAHQCSANGSADNCRFRNGCIDDARFSELFEETSRHFERTAVNADIFSKDEDVIVSFHFF